MYNPQNEMYKIAKRNVHKFQGAKIYKKPLQCDVVAAFLMAEII